MSDTTSHQHIQSAWHAIVAQEVAATPDADRFECAARSAYQRMLENGFSDEDANEVRDWYAAAFYSGC